MLKSHCMLDKSNKCFDFLWRRTLGWYQCSAALQRTLTNWRWQVWLDPTSKIQDWSRDYVPINSASPIPVTKPVNKAINKLDLQQIFTIVYMDWKRFKFFKTWKKIVFYLFVCIMVENGHKIPVRFGAILHALWLIRDFTWQWEPSTDPLHFLLQGRCLIL